MISLRSSALLALPALGLCACDLPQPPGAYEPQDLDVVGVEAEAGTASPDAAVAVFGGMGGGPGGTGSAGGTMGGGQEGGGAGGTDAGSNDPLSALTGDYYVRVDQYNKSSSGIMTVETNAVTYLVAKLAVVNGELRMGDRQCFVELLQTGATTTIPTSEQKGYLPANRKVNVDFATGKWNTERAPYPLGWEPSSNDPVNEAPPTADNDRRLIDNDGKGGGVNVKVMSTGFSCDLRVVQKIDLLFSGTLSGGKIANGEAKNNNSVQNVLVQSALCPDSTNNLGTTKTDTVRFVAAPSSLTNELPCPAGISVMSNQFK